MKLLQFNKPKACLLWIVCCFCFVSISQLSAQNGQFEVRFALKSVDCQLSVATIQVQVRARDMQHTFLMGDANYRFEFDPRQIRNPRIASQEHFSSRAPSSDPNYGGQNLNGTSAGTTLGIVSLNQIYTGSANSARRVDTTWTTVSCIAFDLVLPPFGGAGGGLGCFDLRWHDDQTFPVSGMNEVVVTTPDPFDYSLSSVAAAGFFGNLNACPTRICSNNAPLVVIAPITTYLDSTARVCTNIIDPDSNEVFSVSVCGVGHGTLAPTIVGNQLCVNYTPNPNFVGTDTLCVIVCDRAGACDTVHITANVQARPPGLATIQVSANRDLNENNILDAPDQTYGNVNVQIFSSSNLATPLRTLLIDGAGRATFDGLAAGSYVVRYATPTGFRVATANVGSNDLIDSDIDNNGLTQSITVAAGAVDNTVGALYIPLIAPVVTGNHYEIVQDSILRITLPFTDANVSDSTWVSNLERAGRGTVTLLSVNSAARTVTMTYTPPVQYRGRDTFFIRLTDAYGAFDTARITINVIARPTDTRGTCAGDTIAPVLTANHRLLRTLRSGDTLTVNCTSVPIFVLADVTATDNRGIANFRFYDIGRRLGNCTTDGYKVLMECGYTATDTCGNTTTFRFFVKVLDNQAPTFSAAAPANITVNTQNGQTIPSAATLTATDSCGDARVALVESRQDNACGYILIRTWTATDDCGNFTRTSQSITVQSGLTVNANVTNETCPRNNGAITLTPANYTYAWDGGATGATRTGLRAGSYRVTATAAGCEKVLTFTVADSCVCVPPVVTVSRTNATCNQANGVIALAVDNIANYTFTWSANAGANASVNSRNNLAAGTYTVTVRRTNDTTCLTQLSIVLTLDNTNCCRSFIAQTSVFALANSCADLTSVCIELPYTERGNYTVAVNGAFYTNTFANCNGNTALRLPVGTHYVVFTQTATGCKDTVVAKIVCIDEREILQTVLLNQTGEWCASALNLTSRITSIRNSCPNSGGRDVQFELDTARNCIRYKGLRAGVDTACLVITTDDGNVVNVRFVVTVTLPRCGSNILAADSLTVSGNCENGLAKVCIDLPLDSIPNYDITDNGTAYTNRFDGCSFDTTFAYTYFTVPQQGAAGPYRVDYWVVNGTTYTATVANMAALVDSMNRWDVGGNWRLVASSLNIVGGTNRNIYGAMKLTRLANGSYGILQLNRNLVPRGATLSLSAGLHDIQLVHRATGCNDVIRIRVACVSTDTVNRTIPVNRRDTTCLDTRQLLGSRFTVTNICRTASGERVQFTLLAGTSCVSYLAREAGTERGCFVICDEYGVCDTTIFNITVTASIASVSPPNLQNDRAETIKNTPILINVLSNDNLGTGLLRGYAVAQKPRHGDVLMSATGAAIYTPATDYCGSDTFRYSVCTSGGCDTAAVVVSVLCKDLLVFTGFSPNGDGVNDEFVIQGIERFPNNILRIYNRWGNEVHRADGYRNTWGGKWNDTDLPTGTYFYVLDNGEGVVTSGYIQIMR